MQKNTSIDKKIAATTRVTGYILKIKVSNSGEFTHQVKTLYPYRGGAVWTAHYQRHFILPYVEDE